jgi:hypothetical protein
MREYEPRRREVDRQLGNDGFEVVAVGAEAVEPYDGPLGVVPGDYLYCVKHVQDSRR